MTRNANVKDSKKDTRTPGLVTSAKSKTKLTAAALLVAGAMGCGSGDTTNVNLIPYVPEEPFNPETCSVYKEGECSAVTMNLREAGNTAGTNKLKVGNADVTWSGLEGTGKDTKMVITVESCQESKTVKLGVGDVENVPVHDGIITVVLNKLEYDASGLIANVTAAPNCPTSQ